MILFYTTDIQNDTATFHDEEAHHCTQVLRKRVGDGVTFIDGKGWFYEGEIVRIEKKICTLHITNRREDTNHWNTPIHVAIAPTKNIDRFEWFLEKATEIGIDTITPLLCEHSERKNIRLDRLEKILVAATKQSLKASLPVLNDLTSFSEFIMSPPQHSQQFIAYLGEVASLHLKDAYQQREAVTVMIGPEGDFSPQEIQKALAQGFKGVSLGNSRLRTETAGVVACHILHLG